MLPIPKEYTDSTVELKSMGNSPILLGYISEVTNDGIRITRKEDRLPLIHCNSTVKVNVYNNRLGFRVLIGKVYLSTPEFIRLSDVQNASDYEKRGFYRVPVNVDARAQAVTDGRRNESRQQPFKIRVRDLSLSGLFFVSDKTLHVGDKLNIALTFYEKEFQFLCVVRRSRPVEMGTADGYGCSFEDNTGKKFDLLCKFLFQYQREQIHNMRENKA